MSKSNILKFVIWRKEYCLVSILNRMSKLVMSIILFSILSLLWIVQFTWALSYEKIESELIFPNQAFKYTFKNVGIFNYHCQLHPWLTGKVEVNASNSPNSYVINIPKGAIDSTLGLSFEPKNVIISYGSTVIWENTDGFSHTVANIDLFPKVMEDDLIIFKPIPPLKQLKMGVFAKDVKCKTEFVFIQKLDGSPACVKPETTIKLIERGWIDSTEYSNRQCENSPWTCSQEVPKALVDLDKFKDESLRQEILTLLRKEPKNLNDDAKEFILSEALSDKRVSDLLGDTKFQTFWTINSELGKSSIKYYYGITFQLNEKDEVNVVYDLQQEKITSVELGKIFGSSAGEENKNPCQVSNNLDLEKIPQLGAPSRLVFLVKQNTTAHICIKYSSNFDNEGTLNLKNESIDGFLGTYNGTKSIVSVTINPSTIPLQRGQTTIADYAISVPQDADGVYWLGVSQLCDSIPLVTSNHRIVPDDIPVNVGVHGCPVMMLDAKIIGYSNTDVQYHVAKALPGR